MSAGNNLGTATGTDAGNPAVVTAAPFGKPQSNLLEGGGGGEEPFVSFKDRMGQLAMEGMNTPEPAVEEPAVEEAAQEEQPEVPQKETRETKTAEPDKKEAAPKTGVEALLAEDEPEPATEEKKADEPDPYETPKGLTQKAGQKFAELKAKAKERDALLVKVAEMEGKLKERVALTDADPVKKELEKVKAEYADLRKRQDVFDVETSEAYVKEVTEPVAKAWKALNKLSEDTGVDVEKMADAIREQDPAKRRAAINDIMDELPEYDKGDFRNLVRDVHGIYEREAELRSGAGKAAEELRARAGKESETKRTEARAAEMREVAGLVKQLEPIAKQFAAKGETPEQTMAALNEAAQEVPFDELSTTQKAFAVTAASALARLQSNYKAVAKELAAAKKEIAEYHAAGPETTHVTQNQGTDEEVDPRRSFLDSIIPAHLRR